MTRKFLIAAVACVISVSTLIITHKASAQGRIYPEPQIDRITDGERAAMLQDASARAAELQKELDEKSAPFDAEYAAVSAELKVASQPYRLRIEAIDEEKFNGLAAWIKEFNEFEARLQAATQSLREERDALQAQRDAETASVRAAWDEAINAPGIVDDKADEAEMNAALVRVAELRQEFVRIVAPFEKELAELNNKIDVVRATFMPESVALWTKRHQLIDSCNARSQAVRDEREAAVSHLREKAAAIVKRKYAAVGALQAAVVDANFEIFALTPRKAQ